MSDKPEEAGISQVQSAEQHPPKVTSPRASTSRTPQQGDRSPPLSPILTNGASECSGTGGPSNLDEEPLGTNGNRTKEGGESDDKDSQSCCFCWCCCCSCSCLSVKDNLKITDRKKIEDSDTPPVEQVRKWGESFDKLMKCQEGRGVFREFLRCEYSEENILFWTACEELKNETNPNIIEEKSRAIFEDYVSILSPKEVSLDSKVRDYIVQNLKTSPCTYSFGEAQMQIYTLMHRDSYPRFLNSPMYRKLAQLPSPSRKGSTAVN